MKTPFDGSDQVHIILARNVVKMLSYPSPSSGRVAIERSEIDGWGVVCGKG